MNFKRIKSNQSNCFEAVVIYFDQVARPPLVQNRGQKYYHSLKGHPKLRNVTKFGCEVL